MKTYLDCFPCFFRQILKTTRFMDMDDEKIKEIFVAFGQHLSRVHAEAIPPEIGRDAYRIITEKTGIFDPYAKIKKECTRKVLQMYPKLNERIALSEDPLNMAVRILLERIFVVSSSNSPRFSGSSMR